MTWRRQSLSAAPTFPCGACRQVLWDHCGDIEIVLATTNGRRSRRRLASLLPEPFELGGS